MEEAKQVKISDTLMGIIRKSFEEELASNLITLLEELPILDGEMLLGLPWNANHVGCESTSLKLIDMNRFKNDTCLSDITKAYNTLYCITRLCPSEAIDIDLHPKCGSRNVKAANLHVLMASQSPLSDLIWNNTSLSQNVTEPPDPRFHLIETPDPYRGLSIRNPTGSFLRELAPLPSSQRLNAHDQPFP